MASFSPVKIYRLQFGANKRKPKRVKKERDRNQTGGCLLGAQSSSVVVKSVPSSVCVPSDCQTLKGGKTQC